MRKFFFEMLLNLDKLTGLKQYDKLMAVGKQEVNSLLDILCRVSQQYSYIPETDQQRIISENMIADGEFIGFNAKIIYKWLGQVKGLYYKETIESEALPEGYKPLEGEDRDRAIETWLKSLGSFREAVNVKQEYSGSKMKATLDHLPKVQGYKSTSAEYVLRSELHTQYIKKYYDPYTKAKKEDWISEEEFLLQNGIV